MKEACVFTSSIEEDRAFPEPSSLNYSYRNEGKL